LTVSRCSWSSAPWRKPKSCGKATTILPTAPSRPPASTNSVSACLKSPVRSARTGASSCATVSNKKCLGENIRGGDGRGGGLWW
jgi:hypothetical protein